MSNADTLIRYTSDIVSAHVSHNAVPAEQLPDLIRRVHDALGNVSQTPAMVSREPAIPIKQSVRNDRITCLFCGDKSFKMLRRHLTTTHKMTVDEYRRHWQLPANYPIVAPNYAKVRSALAKEIGLGTGRHNHRRRRRRAA